VSDIPRRVVLLAEISKSHQAKGWFARWLLGRRGVLKYLHLIDILIHTDIIVKFRNDKLYRGV